MNWGEPFGFIATLFLCLFVINSWFKKQITLSNEFQYEELLNPKINANIIILGTSKASVGLNPKYLEGLGTVYNFGAEASRPLYYKQWYNSGFKKHYKNPATIIWCVDWFMFSDGAKHYEYDAEYWDLGMLWRALIDPSLNKSEIFQNLFPMFKYRGFLYSLVSGKFNYKPWLIDKAYRGYVPIEGNAPIQNADQGDMAKVNMQQVIAFFELLYDQKDSRIIFVQLPEYMKGRDLKMQKEGMKAINGFAKFFDIPFIDYNSPKYKWLNENRELFKDWIHLNEKGVKVLGELIQKDLDPLVSKEYIVAHVQ